jgi:hypothetical protein
MKEELDALLCQRYPKIFADCQRTRCREGWFDLIDVLCERLQSRTDRNGAPQVVVTEVKEKWGELSFSVKGSNDEQDGMIAMAEAMSARICESCGKPGKLMVNEDDFLTRCVEHAASGAEVAPE